MIALGGRVEKKHRRDAYATRGGFGGGVQGNRDCCRSGEGGKVRFVFGGALDVPYNFKSPLTPL